MFTFKVTATATVTFRVIVTFITTVTAGVAVSYKYSCIYI